MRFVRASITVAVMAALAGLVGAAPMQVQASRSSAVKLTMWVHSDPNYERIAKKFVTEYQKKTGVKISLTFFPWVDGQAKLATAFAAHDAPNIIQGVASWLFSEMRKKQLAPVPSGIRSAFGNVDNASLVPVKYKKSYYGVPFNVNIDAGPLFIYNKSIWKQEGISPKFSGWNQYTKDLQKLTESSGGTVLRSGLEVAGADVAIQFLMYFLQDGGHFNPPGKATINIDNKYGKEALQTMWNYLYKYKVDSTNNTPYEGIGSGQSASVYWGAWMTKLLQDDFPSFSYGWAKEPMRAGQKPYFPGTNVWAWMVPSFTSHNSAAWAYIKWLNKPAQRLAMSKATGEIPALKSMWKEPAVKNDPRWSAWLPYLKYQVPLLYQAPQDDYYNNLTNMVEAVLLKKESIPAALKQYQKAINNAVTGR